MEIFKELDNLMNAFAENIANEVACRKLYNTDEVKAIVKTRLYMAVYDCLKLQVTQKESERVKLVEQYANAGSDRIKLGAKIAKVNAEKHSINKAISAMDSQNNYNNLRKYVREKYGHEAWKDYRDNYLPSLNSTPNDERSVATDDDSSNAPDPKKLKRD